MPPVLAVLAVYGAGLFCTYAHVVPAAMDVGLTEAGGAGAVSAMGLAGAAGRVLVGLAIAGVCILAFFVWAQFHDGGDL
jgi:hypothetical protein